LLDDLTDLAGLRPGARLLEIGSGTGQATQSLAEREFQITAIELGPNLAAVARRKLARFPNVTIVVVAFEDWALPPEPFDAVVSATAFHWLDPSVRVTKTADALRPGGVLATICTHHIDGGNTAFFIEVQECYRRWFAESAGIRLRTAADIAPDNGELEHSGRFEPATFRRYEWEQPYSAQEYVDLLRTYSDHRALGETRLRPLLDCISRLINERYGGRIRKRYLNELRIARRRASSSGGGKQLS
jgi:SAM-dependent methyltransferase